MTNDVLDGMEISLYYDNHWGKFEQEFMLMHLGVAE